MLILSVGDSASLNEVLVNPKRKASVNVMCGAPFAASFREPFVACFDLKDLFF